MRFSKAFTLVEVNLAIFIMATGVLAMVSLYSLGFREGKQSEEDVVAAGCADAAFAPLVAKLSDTNLTWSAWKNCCNTPPSENNAERYCDGVLPSGRGWGAFVQSSGSDSSKEYRVTIGKGNSGISAVYSAIGASMPSLPGEYFYGLVATRRGATMSLAFRASRRRDALMAQPVYYTEVHFQGDGTR